MYNGYLLTLYGKSTPIKVQDFAGVNVNFVNVRKYDLSLSHFLWECKKGSSVLDALGTWRFNEDEFLRIQKINLDRPLPELKPNPEPFVEYINNLIDETKVNSVSDVCELYILRLHLKTASRQTGTDGDQAAAHDALAQVLFILKPNPQPFLENEPRHCK
ncbi:unnamed protein product [Cylicostephanus goldi]|uniref:Uncharacterized protein n=1 Tax=Cylicostephanus goldi TaxID=71465 RepID=A0A3P6SQF1_CYLGO|nr:unnamed protein product [Cylicostephanus goldi]